MYVLRRIDNWGGYVNYPSRKSSYVVNIHHARKFSTYEEAKANSCGNEAPQVYIPKEEN